ncbi:MAG TPA: tRNA 2-thiouridine(34) synthase MnmA [Candidatus Paceibacterota bacterium]|nr:tRNA 2-thiouridine(34) synthase MnmA [Candidatus Paceibacterota bacterium]
MSNSHKIVFVGMSGGVDSSVTAHLLKEQGYDVVGVFMRCYNIDGCAEADAEDARRVAEHIGIPFYVWDFEQEYKDRVVQYMIEGYRSGITPNPDVMCNREIKFGLFLEKALASGADYVATGHYVKVEKSADGIFRLFAANDSNKDQSYFLWTLGQRQLAHCLFPIGDYIKSEVRDIARRAGLPTAEKKDSQGICFLGKFSLDDFLKQYIPEHRGALLTTGGEHVGEHSGAEFYTIGQRHIDADFRFPKTGGVSERKPLYVASKDAATNTVVMAEGSDDPALYRNEVELAQVNFISGIVLENGPLQVYARVRYRQPLSAATLSKLQNGNYKLIFSMPQKFVAEGQSAVFYGVEGEILGGGIILH